MGNAGSLGEVQLNGDASQEEGCSSGSAVF
jgi:hypothetical protein